MRLFSLAAAALGVCVGACSDDGDLPAVDVGREVACDRDADCLDGSYCESASSICHDFGATGARCLNATCLLGDDFCAGDGRCSRRARLGESCDSLNLPCGLDQVCAGTCQFAGGLEQLCQDDGACQAPLSCVDGYCKQLGRQGQPCHPDSTCDSLLSCIDQVCVSRGFAGQRCLPDGACVEANATCVMGVCLRTGTTGAPCDNGAVCELAP